MIIEIIEKTDEVTGATEQEIHEFDKIEVDGYIITAKRDEFTINIKLNKEDFEKIEGSIKKFTDEK